MPCSAASDLGLQCLSMSNKKDTRLIWVKQILVIIVGIHKMHVRIANREDPDQTASSESV